MKPGSSKSCILCPKCSKAHAPTCTYKYKHFSGDCTPGPPLKGKGTPGREVRMGRGGKGRDKREWRGGKRRGGLCPLQGKILVTSLCCLQTINNQTNKQNSKQSLAQCHAVKPFYSDWCYMYMQYAVWCDHFRQIVSNLFRTALQTLMHESDDRRSKRLLEHYQTPSYRWSFFD